MRLYFLGTSRAMVGAYSSFDANRRISHADLVPHSIITIGCHQLQNRSPHIHGYGRACENSSLPGTEQRHEE
jgi:hypothetical protein